MIEKMINFALAIIVIACFMYLVKMTEKPWPRIEGQPLVQQVGVCQLFNLKTGVSNYVEAINILGLRPDFKTVVGLTLNGPPNFGRRYDCFANLTENEKSGVIASKEYADIQIELRRQMDFFLKPVRGF